MKKSISGNLVFLDGEEFYKIENYDLMDDFFMTITSSSDVWNFLWAQGGISAGRKNCDYSIFPYYTNDKIQDKKEVQAPSQSSKSRAKAKKALSGSPSRISLALEERASMRPWESQGTSTRALTEAKSGLRK